MAQIICFNVFPTKWNIHSMRECLVNDHGFVEKENRNGPYFYAEVPSDDIWQVKAVLGSKRYDYRTYDKRYERSSSYRRDFFAHNKGPYRCAYCGRFLRSSDVEVDHLIPVAKAKKDFAVRTLLQLCGMKSVNDVKNLVAACSKCNGKKSDKINGWVLRGMIGRNKTIWAIRDAFTIAIIIGIGLLVYTMWPTIAQLLGL